MRPLLSTVALLAGLALGAPASSLDYRLVKTVKIGGEGGWDYLAADGAARRLYVCHATRVQVLDLDSLALVGEIPNTPGAHGVALAPDLDRGFVSNGRVATATVFELKTLKPLYEVKTGQDPDAILYDAPTRRVFAFNGRSRNATAIDAVSGKAAGTFALGGKPEFAVSDGAGRVYVNLEDTSEIAVLDPRDMTVKARWSLAPCQEPTGLAMDIEHRRLFSACGNGLMAVVDADAGRVVATLPIGRGTDAAAFDPATGLAFSSNGEGTVTVIREVSPEKFEALGNVPTRRGARTMALDPKTHNLYLCTAEFGPPPARSPGAPRPHRSIVPGTFVVLVVGP
jgi:DNA-binding beta-propeller fold protein YncE